MGIEGSIFLIIGDILKYSVACNFMIGFFFEFFLIYSNVSFRNDSNRSIALVSFPSKLP